MQLCTICSWDLRCRLAAGAALLTVLPQCTVRVISVRYCADLSAPNDLHQAVALDRASMCRHQADSLQCSVSDLI